MAFKSKTNISIILTDLFVAISLILLILSAHLNVLYCPFHYDDYYTIVNNYLIQDIHNLYAVLIRNIFRMIVYLSFALDFTLWELDPFGFHLTNLVIHCINSILVYYLIKKILLICNFESESFEKINSQSGFNSMKSSVTMISMATAAFFAVHPSTGEAVVYISARTTLFSTLFLISGFLFYLSFLYTRKVSTYIICLVFFVFALFSKETAAVFPFLLLLLLILFNVSKKNKTLDIEFNFKDEVLWLIPLIFVVILGGAYRVYHLFNYETINLIRSVWVNIITQINVLVSFLNMFFLPSVDKLSIFHGFPNYSSLIEFPTILNFIILITLLVLSFYLIRHPHKINLLGFGILWFFISLIPVSTVIPLQESLVERRFYFPSLGLCLLVSFIIVSSKPFIKSPSLKKSINSSIWFLIFLLSFSLASTTLARNRMWMNELKIWQEVAVRVPNSFEAYFSIGDVFIRRGKYKKAINAYEQAIKLNPKEVKILVNIGLCYAYSDDHKTALDWFKRAVELDPFNWKAFLDLGSSHFMLKQIKEARTNFEKVLELNPRSAAAYANLAKIEEELGQFSKAYTYWYESFIRELDPVKKTKIINRIKNKK